MNQLLELSEIKPFSPSAPLPRYHAVFYEDDYWHIVGYTEARQVLDDECTFSRLPLSSTMSLNSSTRESVEVFTLIQQRIQALAPRIASHVTDLLDWVTCTGYLEIIAQLAVPLSVRVCAEILGGNDVDRSQMNAWENLRSFVADMRDIPFSDDDYFRLLINARRYRRGDDLLSLLLDRNLQEQELLEVCQWVLVYSLEAIDMIGNTLLCFIQQEPTFIERLRCKPNLIPLAIEEALRLYPPLPQVQRRAQKTVWLAGQQIPKGSQLMVHLDRANRDPRQFSNPDSFDLLHQVISLSSDSPVAPGFSLARLEATIAITSVLTECTHLMLDPAVCLETLSSPEVFGFKSLTVTYDPKPI